MAAKHTRSASKEAADTDMFSKIMASLDNLNKDSSENKILLNKLVADSDTLKADIAALRTIVDSQLKDTIYGVWPDLAPEQRKVKKHHTDHVEMIKSKLGRTYKLKSWRYLIINGPTEKDITYYESDGTTLVPTRSEWVIPQKKKMNKSPTAKALDLPSPSTPQVGP
ncbi:unnamed protein product [Allacma fusca]|uniref:Uncharacterized protein n=1 Tax=Allacma fusca TaxID=39272 RepID=A0A8J2L483_9HEXA|nr:unnamed protein product [Allacma fusca]